jgi:nicotinamide mononucleotide transporter
MLMIEWLTENIVEVFGAVAGMVYVILEIKRNILLWPLGILTSAVYIYVFGRNGFYAGMVLQGYYVVISVYGWYEWQRAQAVGTDRRMSVSGTEHRGQGPEHRAQGAESDAKSDVNNIDGKTALICFLISLGVWGLLWFSLDRWTDSPVPLWDGLITSLSVVATWMLTRKFIEQWYVWILANAIAVIVYLAMGMYPTAILFLVYTIMAIVGAMAWRKTAVISQ